MRISDLDLRHLRALRAVVEEGSFIAAGDALRLSQAAISQQIAGLERAVGHAVFDRPGGSRPVTLTPVGRLVLECADDVTARLERLREDLADLSSGTAGRLRIGTYQSVSVQLLPDLVFDLRAAAPDLAISLVEHDDNDDLVDDLLSGEIDITFLAGPLTDPRLDITVLGVDPYVLIIPADGDLARSHPRRRLPVAALEAVPMVGQHDCGSQRAIDEGLRAAGLRPRYAFRSNDNGAMQGMVRAGVGPAVMPLLAVDTADAGIAVKRLEPDLDPRTIVLAVSSGTTAIPAAQRFMQIARTTCRRRLARSRT